MLVCCNRRFYGGYSRVLSSSQDFYRKIEFGICPQCGSYRFMDFRVFAGKSKVRTLSGNQALIALERVVKTMREEKHGTKSNQNFYYGDYKKTGKKDHMGNPIYLQLKRNFNDEIEILGEVETFVTKLNREQV